MISRQVFLRRLGAALASMVLAGCLDRRGDTSEDDTVTCYEPAIPQDTPTPAFTCYTAEPPPTETPLPDAAAELTRQAQALKATVEAGGLPPDATRQAWAALGRERLRACWSGLEVLAEKAADLEEGEGVRDGLMGEHRAALDDLVSADMLDEAIAARVQFAFQEAAYHVWWDNAPITCYEVAPIQYEPRADLVQRVEALSEVSGGLDAAAVEQAQEALRRDIAFLALFQSGQVQGSDLAELWAAGGFEVSEEDAAAAQFLVELLLGGTL